jgi:hypothetical protein
VNNLPPLNSLCHGFDQQDKSLERVRPDWSLRGRSLAGPPCPPFEEASSPGLEIQRGPKLLTLWSWVDHFRAFGETPGSDVSRHLQLAD